MGNQEAPAPEKPATPRAPRDPNRPRKGEMYLVSGVVTLLAVLLAWGAATSRKEAMRELGEVPAESVGDPEAVPSGAFLSVRGKVDAARVKPLYSARPRNRPDVLLALVGAPRLIVFCPAGHPLNDAVHEHRSGPGARRALDKQWVLSGRIYDRGMAPDPNVELPADAIADFAGEELGLSDMAGIRVLALGVTPEKVRRSARTAQRFAIVMSVVAVGLWVVTIALTLRDRRRATGAGRGAGTPRPQSSSPQRTRRTHSDGGDQAAGNSKSNAGPPIS